MSGIIIKDLCRQWGDFYGVKNVSFEVPNNSFTVLLGPSGCGKSTLLRMICGLEEVSSGTIHIGGKDVTHTPASKRDVSMVFQSYALFPHLSVKENIQFGLKVRKVPAKEREEKIKYAADTVGLSGLLDRKPSQLSGGQRQRVALARSIVSEKSVCLMDEPLSNLDAKLRAEMRDQLRSLQQRLGLTVVYVTHDQVEAMSMADQIVLLESGEIVQVSAPQELYTNPNSVFSAQFIGVPPMNIIKTSEIKLTQLPDNIASLAAQHADPSFIGVRPEHMKIGDFGVPARICAIDYFGGETVIRAKCNEKEIYIRYAGHPDFKNDTDININWNPEDTYIFNKEERLI